MEGLGSRGDTCDLACVVHGSDRQPHLVAARREACRRRVAARVRRPPAPPFGACATRRQHGPSRSRDASRDHERWSSRPTGCRRRTRRARGPRGPTTPPHRAPDVPTAESVPTSRRTVSPSTTIPIPAFTTRTPPASVRRAVCRSHASAPRSADPAARAPARPGSRARTHAYGRSPSSRAASGTDTTNDFRSTFVTASPPGPLSSNKFDGTREKRIGDPQRDARRRSSGQPSAQSRPRP